jgi:hypothetical protein
VVRGHAESEEKAFEIGKILRNANLLVHIGGDQEFKNEDLLYKFSY